MHEGHSWEERQKKCGHPLLVLTVYSMNYCTILVVRSVQFDQAMKEMNDVWVNPVESSDSVYCVLESLGP